MVVGGAEFALVHKAQECFDNIGCELCTGGLPDDGDDLLEVHAVAVGTVGVHGIETVGHGDDLGNPGNLITLEMVRITLSVGTLVVGLGTDSELRHDADVLQSLITLGGMGLYDLELLICQLA